MLTVAALYVYPIKSLGGIALQQSSFDERGLQYDRRWLIVDANNHFITQRTHPSLALLQTQITNSSIIIQHKQTQDSVAVPLIPETNLYKPVTIWDDVCNAVTASLTVNEWLSNYLQQPVDLVFMPNETKRLVDTRYATTETFTGFSDGYSFLMISQASLDELNTKAGTDFGMDRFRPNIVVAGALPQAEEQWHEMTIGNNLFTGVKPCARCVVTTIDQETALKEKEPLATLASYKKVGKRVLFGQNLAYNGSESGIAVGDAIEVMSTKQFEFFDS